MTTEDRQAAAVKDIRAESLPATAAAQQPRRPARLPQITALAATVGAGIASLTGTATLAACPASASGPPQPSLTSIVDGIAAVAHKETPHSIRPASTASATPALKAPATRPAPGKSYFHATSSGSRPLKPKVRHKVRPAARCLKDKDRDD